jgi:ADP-heptose:LPS heptosyltransferase
MPDYKVTILNPKGHDPDQFFPDHAGEVDPKIHAPINFHAYAACTKGAFLRSTRKAISLNQPVLLLIGNHQKRCYYTLQKLKNAGLTVVVSLKETGSHQFAEKFVKIQRLSLFRLIVSQADGVITPTEALVPVYRALRPKAAPESVRFIPLPYPVEDNRWDFSIPHEKRQGIFLGTRELKISSRNHMAALIILSGYIRRHNVKLGLINKDGKRLKKLINELDIPPNLVEVRKPLPYPDYLKFMSSHRIVIQLDQSMVPGQVAGDAILSRMICVGGNGTIDKMVFSEFCSEFHSRQYLLKKIHKLLNDDIYYEESSALTQKKAGEIISFHRIAESLQEFFKHRRDILDLKQNSGAQTTIDINRIIISRTDKIGDLVLSIPSFHMLRKMYPMAKICIIVRSYNYEIVKNLPYIDDIIKVDKFSSEKKLTERIREFNADVFIALFTNSFVAKLARASRAKWKIGPYSKFSSFFTFNKGVRQSRSESIKNEAEYNLDLIRKLNPKLFDDNFEINTKLYYSEKNKAIADNFFSANKLTGKVLILNPFTGGSTKSITDEQYHELILDINKNLDLNIILTCHESEKNRADRIAQNINNIYVFANKGDLLNTAAVIDKGDVYFGCSTGPTHIAGSLQKKIVAIYPIKKTCSATRWGVFGNSSVEYIIPEGNTEEKDYSYKFFNSYNEADKKNIIKAIKNNL